MSLLWHFLSTLIWGPIVAGIILAFTYLGKITKFWKVRDVEFVKPQLLFGNFYNVFVNKENFVLRMKRLYNSINGPFGGFFLGTQPILLARDPELVQQILITDQDKFTDRGLLTGNLMVLKGEQWRPITDELPPAMLSDIEKRMFDALKKNSVTLQEYVERKSKLNNIFDVRELMNRFTIATTASLVFSTEIDSINNPDDTFCEHARLISTPSRISLLRSVLTLTMPNLKDLCRIRTIDADIENFLRKITEEALELRETGKFVGQDFMQIIAQLRNGGKLNASNKWNVEMVEDNNKHLTKKEVFAKIFLFFVYEFDTASSTMSFTLFELAKNKEIQKKLQYEIAGAMRKGDITLLSIKNMPYLDQILNETLRKYPSIPIVARSTLKPYKLPNTEIILDENQEVFIPIYAIHHDPEYYERPNDFNPERFTPAEIKKRKPGTYFPFGDATPDWISTAFALLQTKVAIVAICWKYDLDLAPDRSPDIKFSSAGTLNVEGNLNLCLTERNESYCSLM